MFYDDHRRPEDIPAPPTPDEVAASFPVPLVTLAAQDAVEEAGCGRMSSTTNGHLSTESVTLVYTLWRNPSDRNDPANLADLDPGTRAALDAEPPQPLPDWMLRSRQRMRYPMLWDAVRTTHINDGSTWHTPELALVEHAHYILMNKFRAERTGGRFDRPDVSGAPTEADIEDASIILDGAETPGIRIDTDPHVLAIGADLGDKIFTAVFARSDLPYFRAEFATRARADVDQQT